MNYSTAIFLINNDVRAVSVSYEQDSEGKGIKPFYTFKTFDPEVAVGDYVAIPTGARQADRRQPVPERPGEHRR